MDGKLRLGDMQAQAEKDGRKRQSQRISDYLNKKTPEEISFVNSNEIVYKVANTKKLITVCIKSDGNVTLNNLEAPYFNLRQGRNVSEMQWIKTSAAAARMVVNWIKKYCPEADNMYLDWHTWAEL